MRRFCLRWDRYGEPSLGDCSLITRKIPSADSLINYPGLVLNLMTSSGEYLCFAVLQSDWKYLRDWGFNLKNIKWNPGCDSLLSFAVRIFPHGCILSKTPILPFFSISNLCCLHIVSEKFLCSKNEFKFIFIESVESKNDLMQLLDSIFFFHIDWIGLKFAYGFLKNRWLDFYEILKTSNW